MMRRIKNETKLGHNRCCYDEDKYIAPLLPDNDALVLRIDQHIAVHVVSEGVDVGRIFVGRLVATK